MKAILYDWGGANLWLFLLINGIHAAWLDRIMRLGTTLGGHGNYALYLALAALIAVYSTRRGAPDDPDRGHRVEAWLAVLAVFSVAYVLDGWLIGWLKPALDFPRPLLALPPGSVVVVGGPELHHSLPSGHASFAMLLAASLWPVLGRRARFLMGVFVLWVGLSRISVGAHFPADVAAGYALSWALVWLVRREVSLLGRSR